MLYIYIYIIHGVLSNWLFCAGSLAAARIIVEMCGKAVINDVDEQSRTALHLATIGGHGDVVNFLLEQGGQF